jgi:hypothetical protein
LLCHSGLVPASPAPSIRVLKELKTNHNRSLHH